MTSTTGSFASFCGPHQIALDAAVALPVTAPFSVLALIRLSSAWIWIAIA